MMARTRQDNFSERIQTLNELLIARLAYHDYLAREVWGHERHKNDFRGMLSSLCFKRNPRAEGERISKGPGAPRCYQLSTPSFKSSRDSRDSVPLSVNKAKMPVRMTAKAVASAKMIAAKCAAKRSGVWEVVSAKSADGPPPSQPTVKKPLRQDILHPEIRAIMKDPYRPFRSESPKTVEATSTGRLRRTASSKAERSTPSSTDDTSAEDEVAKKERELPELCCLPSKASSKQGTPVTFHQLILASALSLLGAFPNGRPEHKVSSHRLPSFWEIL